MDRGNTEIKKGRNEIKKQWLISKCFELRQNLFTSFKACLRGKKERQKDNKAERQQNKKTERQNILFTRSIWNISGWTVLVQKAATNSETGTSGGFLMSALGT